MVAFAALLGTVITNLIRNATVADDYLFCSTLKASDASGFPIIDPKLLPTTPSTDVPNSDTDSIVKHTNFLAPPPATLTEFAPQAQARGCVLWFEHDYPTPRSPYELYGANVSLAQRKDTTFAPDPLGGWLSPSQLALPVKLAQLQTYPWAAVLDLNGASSGSKPKLSAIRSATQLGALQNSTNGDGLLSLIETNAYVNIVTSNDTSKPPFGVDALLPVPFYEKLSAGKTEEDADDFLTERIQASFARLAVINKTTVVQNNQNPIAQLQYFTDIADIVKDVPWGAIVFAKVDAVARRWGYTLQIGTDRRISRAASFPSESLRRVAQQSQLSNAFCMPSI
jgi:hypothetical protein